MYKILIPPALALLLSACVSAQQIRGWEPDHKVHLSGKYDVIANCFLDKFEDVSYTMDVRQNAATQTYQIIGHAFSILHRVPFIVILIKQKALDVVAIELRGRATIFNRKHYSNQALVLINQCSEGDSE